MFGFAICWHMLVLCAVCSAICSVNLNNIFLSYKHLLKDVFCLKHKLSFC